VSVAWLTVDFSYHYHCILWGQGENEKDRDSTRKRLNVRFRINQSRKVLLTKGASVEEEVGRRKRGSKEPSNRIIRELTLNNKRRIDNFPINSQIATGKGGLKSRRNRRSSIAQTLRCFGLDHCKGPR